MEKHFSFEFEGESPIRLDKFLSNRIPDISRSQIQRLIKTGNVLVDEAVITKNGFTLNKLGHVIDLVIPEPEPLEIQPEKIDLNILYEDENVIVVNKQSGMVMHPSIGHSSGTLVHAALGYDPFLDGIGGKMRPGIVHRLDKNTSGVVILAKNDTAHVWLQKQFKNRLTTKKYIALVDKHPPTESGRIEAPIYRDPVNRKKMAIAPEGKGKHAVTIFQTIEKLGKFSLLDIQILTGRTHQIRVHLASVGSPITGDTIYGYSTHTLKMDRHFLHAKSLAIQLPGANKKSLFEAPIPQELDQILKDLSP